jgi:gamma-glutamyltranspeptidase/glutathione hydrolase
MKHTFSVNLFLVILLLALCSACQTSKTDPYPIESSENYEKAAVVSAHPLASKIGVDILKAGGNAVDAAVASQFALAVVYPRAGNIGGGGFMLIRRSDGLVDALDYRGKSPRCCST